jgi:hypothetical protein
MPNDASNPGDDQLRALVRALLWSLLTGDPPGAEIFTADVVVDSPLIAAANRFELLEQIDDRRGVLSTVELEVERIEREDSIVEVLWRFRGIHTGPLLVNDDQLFEPTGRQLGTSVVSRLELRDGRVCHMRHVPDVDFLDRARGDASSSGDE